MKKLIDLFFGKNRHCDFGRLRLRRKTGELIEVEKSLRYTIKSDGAKVTLNSYSELVHFSGKLVSQSSTAIPWSPRGASNLHTCY